MHAVNLGYASGPLNRIALITKGRIMKTLNAYAIVAENTDLRDFTQIADSMENLSVSIERDIEAAIARFNEQAFDLIILDKGLPQEMYNKMLKLTDLLQPDAASIAFIMTDKEFIRYKMAGLIAKWMDANSAPQTNFLDNPKM